MTESPPGRGSLPSPDKFFEAVHGFHRTSAIRAGIELDVFTLIGEGAETSESLALRCRASERGIRILCDFLVVIGFLTKSGNRYQLTRDSRAFLDRRSPAYAGDMAIRVLLSPTNVESFSNLAEAVRKGGTATTEEGVVAPEHPIWVEFARSMAPMMAIPAELLAKLLDAEAGQRWKVLDIAAGHGKFGLAIAKHNPNAEVVAVDWRNVLVVAQEIASAEGLSNRFRTIPGSAFDVDFGGGYDLVLIANLLHHFDPTAIQKLLSKVYLSLNKGGRAVILEIISNEDRLSPSVAVEGALIMLAITPNGDTYTFREYREILARAGFVDSELHELSPTFFRAVVARK